jgi:hypothetical protein
MSSVLSRLTKIEAALQNMQNNLGCEPGVWVMRTVEVGGVASDATLSQCRAAQKLRRLQE